MTAVRNESDAIDLFVIRDGKRIAKRGFTRIFRFADSIATMEDGRIGSVRSAPFAQLAEVA